MAVASTGPSASPGPSSPGPSAWPGRPAGPAPSLAASTPSFDAQAAAKLGAAGRPPIGPAQTPRKGHFARPGVSASCCLKSANTGPLGTPGAF